MQEPSQLTIRGLMGVTAIVAIWCAVFTISANSGWLFLGVAVALCAASILRKAILLFFVPLIFSSNLMLSANFAPGFGPPPTALFCSFVVVFVIAVSEYTIRRTRDRFRTRTHPSRVVFVAIQNGAISGIIVALQFGLPVLVTGLCTWFTPFPVRIGILAYIAIFFPLMTCTIFGVALGSVLGIVCARLIASDLENRQIQGSELERDIVDNK